MSNLILMLFVSLVLLLGNQWGCGGDDAPSPPTYQEDPELTKLKKNVLSRTQQLMDVPYEDWLERFSPSETTTGYATDIAGKYKSLIDTEDYDIADYSQIEEDYLDTVLRKYKEARGESGEALKESLIGQNLYESGPGYEFMKDFGEETATGVADITKQWAYEGIQRQMQQRQYMDALKRGDYTTMYNLTLSEIQREMTPVTRATEAELAGLEGGMGLFGTMTEADLAKYQQELSAWEAMARLEAAEEESNLGGVGGLLGAGAGYLLAPAMTLTTGPFAGMSAQLLSAMMGGTAGAGIGSMFEY